MNQIYASFTKTFRELLRDKVILGSTFGIPFLFLLLFPIIMFRDTPQEILPTFKGMNTLAQIALMIMVGGMSNLAGSIVGDRERGLYRKLASMPVRPFKEVLGRILATFVFTFFGAVLFLLVGYILGASFLFDIITLSGAIFFFLLLFIASVGIGLIIASLVDGESAATHLGIGISLVMFFLGIGIPYSQLPRELQIWSRINPLSSAFAPIISLLEGEQILGYNPFTIVQIALLIVLSLLIFSIGVFFYSKIAWSKN